MDVAEAARAAPPAIRTEGLTKRYGDVLAVADVTFAVAAGEVFGLIGENGAGKTTLVKMLTTLLAPSAGSGFVAGFDILRDAAEVRRHIGYVPQLLSVDGSLTGYENMMLSARLYATPHHDRRARIREALEAMGLAEAADRLVQNYSGGMIRRLEIAQSMLHRPSVLFMDEPTVGLDPLARDAVWTHVRDLRRRFGMTMLLTTHYLDEADNLCDRIAIMNRGRIVALGTPAELKALVGPQATLDQVMEKLVGGESETLEKGGLSDVRRERRTVITHR
ncbi:MAG TPA: ATP-binding cassette domain-containing protein [Stellaceae bacterium]|jgi:ABC-2 type transport system ATP-binding protein|nr:ATP-binding cassette domain-containing protein [Stellaceae bacterium]